MLWFVFGFVCGMICTGVLLFISLFQVRFSISPTGIHAHTAQPPYTSPQNPHLFKHTPRTGRISQRIRTKRIDVSSQQHVTAYISSTIAAMNVEQQEERARLERRALGQQDGQIQHQRQIVHGISESCIWINVLAQRFFHSFLESLDPDNPTSMEETINKRLETLKLPSFIGAVSINDISFGDVFPVLHHIHVLAWQPSVPLEFEASLTYSSSSAYLCLETSLQLNYPIPLFATLPIEAAISNLFIEATVHIIVDPSIHHGFLSLSFVTSPTIEFTLNTEIGHQHTVNDIPYLQTALHSAIHTMIREMLVHPNRHTIPIKFPSNRRHHSTTTTTTPTTPAGSGSIQSTTTTTTIPTTVPTTTSVASQTQNTSTITQSSSDDESSGSEDELLFHDGLRRRQHPHAPPVPPVASTSS